ncbi:MAG: T9SS type A sorting domain-containing protein [Flavobacteriales bacterium]
MKHHLLSFLLLLLTLGKLNAQMIYIPDPNFRAYLQQNFAACMNGDSLNASCSAVQNASSLSVYGLSISDLSGIEAFVNLGALRCHHNQINFLPPLPPNLFLLDCTHNQLNSLPSLPPNLTILLCGGNLLTSLPSLPSNLQELHCDVNELSYLPPMPPSLLSLRCSYNQLTTLPNLYEGLNELNISSNLFSILPQLPESIMYLTCSNNQFTSFSSLPLNLRQLYCDNNSLYLLPSLPSHLNLLDCFNNNLTSLPDLPSFLTTLKCSGNFINSLPALPVGLTELDCGVNELTSLPTLPNSLNHLMCGMNQISSLPPLPESLIKLWCSSNLLTTLPSLPSGLIELSCGGNFLTDLPFLPSGLRWLNCGNNQLTNLPPLPASLTELICSNNQITAMPPLPNLTAFFCQNNNLSCLPTIPNTLTNSLRFNITNNPLTCLPNYVPAMNAQTLAMPLCDENNANGCPVAEGIIGGVYNDQNNNCMLNISETQVINVAVKLYDDQNNLLVQSATFSNNGIFNVPFPNGDYKVKIDTLNKPYRITCSTPGDSLNFSLTPSQPLFSAPNFPVRCKPGFDVGVQSIVPEGWVFPGQTHTLRVLAGDMSQWMNLNCAQGIAGQVQITLTGPVVYAGVPAGALVPQVVGNVFTYNIANFANANFQNSFRLLLTTDTTAQSGDPVCVQVVVTPTNGDNFPSNNQMQFCYNVINSYDPNRKDVSPSVVLPGYEDWITYSVYFQNTGTAPAFNIRLRDTLSSYFDYSTFELLNYSHPNTYEIRDSILIFFFPNIMLPDSASNPQGSIGFVQFRMKPLPGLSFGHQIDNQVAIYFDFNEPIFTNIANTSYTQCEVFSSLLQLNECEPVTVNNMTYTQSGTYVQHLQNVNGCDSLLTLQISISKNEASIQVQTCESYSLNGVTYEESGTYLQTLVNQQGCDSLLTIHLNITEVELSITQENNQLIVNAPEGDLQWLDCTQDFLPIEGATGPVFTPIANGSYAVAHFFNECVIISEGFPVIGLSIQSLNPSFTIYPVPTGDLLYWQCLNYDIKGEGALQFSITDMQGRLVHQSRITEFDGQSKISVANLASGGYFFHVSDSQGRFYSRLFLKQ